MIPIKLDLELLSKVSIGLTAGSLLPTYLNFQLVRLNKGFET